MPQVWLSYDEVGRWLRHDTRDTAEHVLRQGWSRRRCRDGLTRIKLPPSLIESYLRHHLRMEAIDRQADAQVQELRSILQDSNSVRRGAAG